MLHVSAQACRDTRHLLMGVSCIRPSEIELTPPPSSPPLASVVQCLEMTTKRKLIGRLVPCRCFRGEEEVISVLDYSHCSLQQVPKEIFSFERTLEELYLDANQIEELPKVTTSDAHVNPRSAVSCLQTQPSKTQLAHITPGRPKPEGQSFNHNVVLLKTK